jgi:hypothetical protein
MLGEFFREAAVLVVVFVPLDAFMSNRLTTGVVIARSS